MTANRLPTAEAAKRYMLAGKATVTLRSNASGTHFTYEINQADDGSVHFVAALVDDGYLYLGMISNRGFRLTKKSAFKYDNPRVKAFDYAWKAILAGKMPPQLDVFHDGTCGRCKRQLTHPDSIETGLGPECATKGNF